MSKANKERILVWLVAVCVAGIFLLISNWLTPPEANPNRTTILVKAPEPMVTAFENTFKELGLYTDYVIEQTDDEAKANFVVREGMNKEGKLIAYSPIIAITNYGSDYRDELREKEILVKSEVSFVQYDLDFYKVIQKAINREDCEFKVYYPSKDSDTWDEFYSFILFTVNDGYYPGTAEEMKQAKQIADEFLNSKYAEPFNNNTIERSNGIAKNSIYFMTWADLARLHEQAGGFSYYPMYPKTVVYHSYYATYDELGKIIYDTFEAKKEQFLFDFDIVGYYYLRAEGFNTKYYKAASSIGNWSQREKFNGVEIPKVENYIYNEEENSDE